MLKFFSGAVTAALVTAASVTGAYAQVANPAETKKSEGQTENQPGKDGLGGTMPNNTVPAMTPDAGQSSTAGTTMGPDGKLTKHGDAMAPSAESGSATGASSGSEGSSKPAMQPDAADKTKPSMKPDAKKNSN